MSLFNNLKITPDSIQKATDWFKRKIRDLHLGTLPYDIGFKNMKNPLVGHMFLFHYDAKLKETLPYWDTYPLVLPFNVLNDRFYGLNLHYLPYEYRLQLLGALGKLIKDSTISDQKKFELTWGILKESSRMNLIQPCVKQYLLSGNHVQSKLLMIHSDEWFNAVLLPLEAFKAKDKNKDRFVTYDKHEVWRDSIK